MRFRASTFLALLTFTFHELPFALCSGSPGDATPQQVDGAHRPRGLVVERQDVTVTEIGTTNVVTATTQVEATVTESANPILETRTSTLTAAPTTPTQTTTPTVAAPETTITSSTLGGPIPTCPVGHYQCPAQYSGGCCPSGFGCAVSECIPPATVTSTRTCMPSSSSCPDSVGGGCCPDNYSCGVTICSPLATATAIVITEATLTFTRAPFAMTATQIVMKATDIPINAKIPASTATSPHPSQSSDPSKGTTLPKITLVGIVVGSVIGTLLLVGVAWFTRYRLRRRGNTDAFHAAHSRDGFMPAPTGRTYDPNQPVPRMQRTVPHRALPGFLATQQQQQQQLQRQLQQQQQAGNMYADPASATHQPGAAEMEVKYYQHNQEGGINYAPVPLDSPPLMDYKENQERAELGDTSLQPQQQQQSVLHEVEGDLPASPRQTRRWSNGLERLGIRRGNSTSGGGGTHF
ncbi:hypothetical protein BZA05DRAFT_387019 [Tricharina praecox]|uniref:uncharacterized protein n=1 Tax=Tricharina praecox TaxID=43433 RepID=UPI00221FCE6E|nr:uncharacterized protein BZA05DRAFT_387019 [Tricharina praecox]KAI5857019.1 hypothetical protein BZA05DRAFT_387019 [Tricharina praecox]